MNRPRTTLEEAVAYLRSDERFQSVLTDLVEKREHSIAGLGVYKTETELKKLAAEVTVYTEFLDMFGVPMGEASE